MPTINQLIRKGREQKVKNLNLGTDIMSSEEGCVHKGNDFHTKKPNSALRKVAR